MKKYILFFVLCVVIALSMIMPWETSGKMQLVDKLGAHYMYITTIGYEIFWGRLAIACWIITMILFILNYKRISLVANLCMIAIAVYFYFDGAGSVIWKLESREIPVDGHFSYGFYLYILSTALLFVSTWMSYKREQKT
jgi:hypothetical protein